MKFKEVEKFPGYFVCSNGTILSQVSQVQVGSEYTNGYFYVTLCLGPQIRKRVPVHRLVWETFVGPIDDTNVVHHLDHNRSNNSLSNLKCISREQNTREAIRKGFNKGPFISKGKDKRFSKEEAESIRKEYADGGISYMNLAVKYKRNLSSIYHLIKGNSYSGISIGRLKEKTVKEIRKMISDGVEDTEIIEKFSISQFSFDNIKTGKSYPGV